MRSFGQKKKSGLDISAGPVPANDVKPKTEFSFVPPQRNQVPQQCLSLSGSTGISWRPLNWDSFASFGSLSCKSAAADSSWCPPNPSMTPATSGVRPISCLRATVTTHRENTGDGAHSWRVVKRATRFNAFPLCSFVSETLADSSCTSQDRLVTNGLTTHHNSSGVTTARGLDTDAQIANVETQKLKVALDPHCCSNSASQLVARPPQNIACDGLLCTGMDSSGEREKVECFFFCRRGRIAHFARHRRGTEPIMLQASRHVFVSRAFVQVMRTTSSGVFHWLSAEQAHETGYCHPLI